MGMRGRFPSGNLYPPSNTTRFTFEALAFLLPFLKLAKVGKAGEFAKAGNLGKMIDPAPFLKPKINPSALGGHLFPRNYDPLGGLTPGKFLKKYWDPEPLSLVAERQVNATFYQYGYLREADTLCFWRRERAQLRNAVLSRTELVPGCVL